MTAMTVTMRNTIGTDRMMLAVKVLTGINGVGRTAVLNSGHTTTQLEITPQASGSRVYGSLIIYDGSDVLWPYSVNADTTEIYGSAISSRGIAAFRSTDLTTAETPVTLGYTSKGIEDSTAIALCEILSDGTLAEDASSPAVSPIAGYVTSVTTGSFNPPDGSYLIAIGSFCSFSGQQYQAISDSLGLTWTEQGYAHCDGGQTKIWTAGPLPTIATPGCVMASVAINAATVTRTYPWYTTSVSGSELTAARGEVSSTTQD